MVVGEGDDRGLGFVGGPAVARCARAIVEVQGGARRRLRTTECGGDENAGWRLQALVQAMDSG